MVGNPHRLVGVFPFATNGEALSESGYNQKDISGTFYVLDHGLEINNLVNEAKECHFEDGQITGALEGTFEVNDGTNFITISANGVAYKGIMVEMTDEAGNSTFCISAVGDNNHSIWGVRYGKTGDQ